VTCCPPIFLKFYDAYRVKVNLIIVILSGFVKRKTKSENISVKVAASAHQSIGKKDGSIIRTTAKKC